MIQTSERRRLTRVDLPGIVRGSVSLRIDVQVINLSPGGAQIEHAERLFPGSTCILFLRLGEENLRLGAEIVWSRVHRVQAISSKTGEGRLHYRSGVRFRNIPERSEAHIRRYLAPLTHSAS